MPRIIGRFTKHYTEFGSMVASILRQAGVSHIALATSLDVSPAALCMVLNGARKSTPQWAEAIARVIGASDEMKRNLHLAAARSVGYEIWINPDDAPSISNTSAPP